MDTSVPQTPGRMARPSVLPEAHSVPFLAVAEGMHAGLASDWVDKLPREGGQQVV